MFKGPDVGEVLAMSELTEKFFRAMDRARQGRQFKDEAEMQAFMNSFVGANIDDLVASQEMSPEDRAMEWVDQAGEARTREQAVECLRKALEADPGCCEAKIRLARLESRSDAERLLRLEEAIASEEGRLGPVFFKEEKGHFWGMTESRPYMRACADRAWLLLDLGHLAEAQKAFRTLIQLNKHDNQGIRMILGPLCLRRGDLKAYRALRNKFKRTPDLELLWGDVLEAFLLDDLDRAVEARVLAREGNGYLEAYLLGHRKLPKQLPASYTWKSPEQAACAASHLIPAWATHPKALGWLKATR